MKTILAAMTLLSAMFVFASNANAQLPSMLDLARDVDRAASTLSGKKESFLGFKKLEMPELLKGFLDVRFKKPTMPSLGILDKLKNIGKPQFESTAPTTQGPILAGLSKLFPQRQATPTPSLLDRMLGKAPSADNSSLFSAQDISELNAATKGLQEHVGRISREVRTNATDLVTGQNSFTTPQPPLRSARQHSSQSGSGSRF